ncbi:transglycosylase [Bradyrhizobium macuxiense]|uniref:Transglycosylase n=2 Tax=Bradyrhizobium macuxiense TaxID=1755647 RepID=A0A125Q837_9BRAD|nr:transglycosylase [Bradyrhizobium macuxiense]
MRRKLAAMPRALRIAVVGAAIVVLLPLANVAYQVARKPTELFFFVGTALDKEPPETWRQYGAHFRTYSTDTVTPELLAALAQTESSGNPVTRTYWRWRLTWNPLAIYKPASSAVGLYQMTDPAFAEANRHCIRQHAVVATGCWFNSLHIRVLPSHATELAAVYLDRNVASVLAAAPKSTATPQQKQDLAAVIHLCGAGPGQSFVRRGFQPAAGEHCGDHLVSAYLARVNGMKRQFLKLAASDKT